MFWLASHWFFVRKFFSPTGSLSVPDEIFSRSPALSCEMPRNARVVAPGAKRSGAKRAKRDGRERPTEVHQRRPPFGDEAFVTAKEGRFQRKWRRGPSDLV